MYIGWDGENVLHENCQRWVYHLQASKPIHVVCAELKDKALNCNPLNSVCPDETIEETIYDWNIHLHQFMQEQPESETEELYKKPKKRNRNRTGAAKEKKKRQKAKACGS